MIELFINNTNIDLAEGPDNFFPLTFQQADARNPEKRKRNASKTIVLPGTQSNNKFFQSAYDLSLTNVDGDLVGFNFDPTLRYPATVKRNGEPIFIGACSLTKVTTKRGANGVRINKFSVVLYSNIVDVFQALGDLKVSELGWSEYDETLSVANIVSSWSAATGSGIWWPYVDWGYADDPTYIKTNELLPYVYMVEIFQKGFAVGGYTISGTWISSTLAKQVTYGRGGGEQIGITASEVTERRVQYTGDGSASYNFGQTGYLSRTEFEHIQVIPFNNNAALTLTLVNDDTAQYNTTTGEIVTAFAGYYNLAIDGSFPITYAFSDITLTDQLIAIQVTVRTTVNFAVFNETTHLIVDTSGGSDTAVFDIDLELDLSVGDVVKIDLFINTNGTSVGEVAPFETFDVTFDFNNTLSIDMTAQDSVIVDGDTVKVSRFLPDAKAADVIKDFIISQNLYVSEPNEDNEITILPQDQYFYDTDDFDDWSDKLDHNSEMEIEPASNIEGKTYRFKFATDRDYYKELYFQARGKDYGDKDYEVPSTWKKGVKLYEVGFAQSCPVQLEGLDIVIPRVIKVDESTLVTTPYKGKPRIFLNSGTRATADGWTLVNSDTGAESAQTVWPVAHHLDDIESPTFDFNFEKPDLVYYDAATLGFSYTTENLFSRYHAQFIRELTGRDSKIINAWFRLTEVDAYENFMRRLCNIDGVLFRKNVIKDWIINSNNLVKCELIRIVDGNSRGEYATGTAQGQLPALMPTGDPTAPISSDTTARSSRGMYVTDTSTGDVTITLDADTLRKGWTAEFPKISEGGTLYIQPSGGTQQDPATLLGSTDPLAVVNQFDAPQIRFDGKNFYLK